MTLKEWKTQSGDSLFDKRSAELQGIDSAFETYSKAPTAINLEKLDIAVAKWKLFKGATAWLTAKRQPAVSALGEWIRTKREEDGSLKTASQLGWHLEHHCYAYAMKNMFPNKAPNGAHANPGDRAAVRMPGGTPQVRYREGVVADAAAQNKVIRYIGYNAFDVPGQLTVGGEYLVAMLASQAGFHFMRREEHTQLWTHKNGGHGSVEASIYDQHTQRYVNLTNHVVRDLLANAPKRKFLGTGNMTFQAYFAVPHGGIKVGRPGPPAH